ncbi:MAG: hypothetical protein QOK40_1134, partial [Miltoncostaeaceae bacterium]|nr:hypothetical protein [Miltoncostaeaceae bacterium]
MTTSGDAGTPPDCPNCGFGAPTGAFCVRCGHPLADAAAGGARRGFAAAPHERRLLPALASTLFPQLPRGSLATFRWALALGTALLVGLALGGLSPVALVAAATLVPTLMLVYLYDVDIYEDEPLRVVAVTMAWGVVAGIGVGVVGRLLDPAGSALLDQSTASSVLLRGVALPCLATALAIAGPLVLLPYRKFNDVLDGATFGVAAATCLVGGQVLTESSSVFGSGLRPVGLVWPWVVRVLELGLALPVLAGAAAGAAVGAIWLPHRAPVRDRGALGILGRPAVATAAAAALVCGGSLAQLAVGRATSLALLVALDALALLWLRQVVHLGLVQEAAEVPVGPALVCANCGRQTPRHSFCAHCGVSLLALPKPRPASGSREESGMTTAPDRAPIAHAGRAGASGARLLARRLLLIFGGAIAAIALATTLLVLAAAPGDLEPPCPSGPVGCEPSTRPPLVTRTPWRSTLYGFSLAYDDLRWRLVEESDTALVLRWRSDDSSPWSSQATLRVEGSAPAEPALMVERRLDALRSDIPDLALNDDPRREILNPQIAGRPGAGANACGTVATPQGGNASVDVVVLAAQQPG